MSRHRWPTSVWYRPSRWRWPPYDPGPSSPSHAIYDRQVDYTIGIPLIVAAVAINELLPARLSALFWFYRVDLFSLPIFVAGAVAILFGCRVLWRQKLAISFLFLAWPYPYEKYLLGVLNAFTNATLVAMEKIAVWTHLATPSDVSTGNPLFTVDHHGTTFALSIVSACSGVNSVVGFLLVGSVFAVIVKGPIVRKVLWLAGGHVSSLPPQPRSHHLHLLRRKGVGRVHRHQCLPPVRRSRPVLRGRARHAPVDPPPGDVHPDRPARRPRPVGRSRWLLVRGRSRPAPAGSRQNWPCPNHFWPWSSWWWRRWSSDSATWDSAPTTSWRELPARPSWTAYIRARSRPMVGRRSTRPPSDGPQPLFGDSSDLESVHLAQRRDRYAPHHHPRRGRRHQYARSFQLLRLRRPGLLHIPRLLTGRCDPGRPGRRRDWTGHVLYVPAIRQLVDRVLDPAREDGPTDPPATSGPFSTSRIRDRVC